MSINILEEFIGGAEKRTRMPVVSCIGSVTDDEVGSVIHNWENAVDVDPTEMSCQVILISPYHVFACIRLILLPYIGYVTLLCPLHFK